MNYTDRAGIAVGLERGPLGLVSTIEELLERKSSGSGLENREYCLGIRRTHHATPLYPQMLAQTSPTSGFRSVGIVRSRTKATELLLLLLVVVVAFVIRIYKTTILPVVLYGCETWSLTLREEHRLGVVENRVLRRVFGPKRDEVTGEQRKLHNKELHDLYSSLSITRIIKARRMRWAGHVARMGEKRNAYRLLVGKPEGRRSLGRLRRRWLDNICRGRMG
jgi:hypothetical protein